MILKMLNITLLGLHPDNIAVKLVCSSGLGLPVALLVLCSGWQQIEQYMFVCLLFHGGALSWNVLG